MSRVLVIVILALLFPPEARSTVYAPFDEATLTSLSTAIVTGRVTSSAATVRGARVVTETIVAVDSVLKGATAGVSVTITTPGGRAGDRDVVVYGAPRFGVGDEVLVYVQRAPDGELRTTGLALGAYRLETAADGSLVGARAVPTPERRSLADVAAMAQALGDPGAEVDGSTVPVTAEFNFLGSPPGRWFEPDDGQPVRLRMANSDATQGASSGGIVDAALGAWTNVPTASITLERAGSTGTNRSIAGGVCDGQSNVTFNDPFNELRGLTQCSGVLAVGGFCSQPGSTGVVGGRTFGLISEGDLTLADGLGACVNRKGLEEIITHEVGHVIGLGHSSENPNESNPTLRDATMFFLAHLDGRGAAVRADDVAGVSTIYPVQVTIDPDDLDDDGILNDDDACPSTPGGSVVDAEGCACGEPGRAVCDDGLACTNDLCDPNTAACGTALVDCSGGDPCLTGTCDEAIGCSTLPVPGNSAVLCVYRRTYPPAVCGTSKLPRGIRKRIARAEQQAGRGVGTGDSGFFVAADKQLVRALRIVDKAARRKRRPLPPDCTAALTAFVDDARARLPLAN